MKSYNLYAIYPSTYRLSEGAEKLLKSFEKKLFATLSLTQK